MPKKITQNINKDAGLLDLPDVNPQSSKWKTEHSNYVTCNIGEIYPIYVDEVLANEKRKVTMGMLSHMTTPIAPIFNAQYTEFRSFFVPYRLCADLLGGYATRKSPFVKVFGEDNASTGANIIVPLANQKLPSVSVNLMADVISNLNTFGGILDALDYDTDFSSFTTSGDDAAYLAKFNFLDLAAYELIYQYKYRNQNREAATSSDLYKWCYNLYNRTSVGAINFSDDFHIANREKDYFTGSQPFTQKGASVSVGLSGTAPVMTDTQNHFMGTRSLRLSGNGVSSLPSGTYPIVVDNTGKSTIDPNNASSSGQLPQIEVNVSNLVTDLSQASGVDIEQLRIMIKTQELLEKDMSYGSDFISSLNAHFGCAPMSLLLDEPLELKKVTITSHMQPIFQTSTTSGEQTILGTIGANATTQSGEFEIVPETKFLEPGLLIICAVHKSQNSYDSRAFKQKRLFKNSRFDFYTPELDDLGYQPVSRLEFNPTQFTNSVDEAVSFNEAWAEYRYKYNKVHGMFEPSRSNALDYWTLAMSGYADVQSIYKQGLTELDRAISIKSVNAPQFFDAYGFVETNDKPMKLHSIPGMDGVI